jgi:hypothetical protein
MKKQIKLYLEEAIEIADILTNTENPDEDYDITENALAEKWGIDVDTFYEIANGIFQMIDFGMSPITQTPFVGISKGNMWLAKKEVDQQFINAVINWATDGEDIPEGKAFVRTIFHEDKPEFDIKISRPKTEDIENIKLPDN